LDLVAQRSPRLCEVLQSMEVETLMVVRVSMDDEDIDGYLLCAEPRSRRIWQEAECAIMDFLATLIAGRIRIAGGTLDE
ncbi:MAG: hypothetical protein IJ089_11225, partial [Clostridia bacterium]|nr:hypothetical protein [Clostridia bacterium]